MISAHSRSVGSCDRCVLAMVLYELAELALHIRCLPAITTIQPMRRQRLICLTWIALLCSGANVGAVLRAKTWSLSLFRDRVVAGLSPTTLMIGFGDCADLLIT